jgi:hypothetical protein
MKFATTLINTNIGEGIELLKWALGQVTYKINQVNIW